MAPINRRGFFKRLAAAGVALALPGLPDTEAGPSIVFLRQYQARHDAAPCRVDVLYGWQTVQPSLVSRLLG